MNILEDKNMKARAFRVEDGHFDMLRSSLESIPGRRGGVSLHTFSPYLSLAAMFLLIFGAFKLLTGVITPAISGSEYSLSEEEYILRTMTPTALDLVNALPEEQTDEADDDENIIDYLLMTGMQVADMMENF
ncbi:MAG: hypothetical protein HUJ94_01685 [Bacteroidales bacterium]|nr:hypothetical protein [Bacteroidales bacterium]